MHRSLSPAPLTSSYLCRLLGRGHTLESSASKSQNESYCRPLITVSGPRRTNALTPLVWAVNRARRSTANYVRKSRAMALALCLVLLIPYGASTVSNSELNETTNFNASSDVQMNLYTMHIASQNSSAGGDGYITTQVPESGARVHERIK